MKPFLPANYSLLKWTFLNPALYFNKIILLPNLSPNSDRNSKHMPAAPDWLCNMLLEHLLGFLVHSFVFLIMVIDDVPVGSELTLFFFSP